MESTVPDDRPAPGEEHNPGAPTAARQAATVIVLRGAKETLEVLLVRRTPAARFMGGVWVFPGGAVDAEDRRLGGAPAGEGEEAGRGASAATGMPARTGAPTGQDKRAGDGRENDGALRAAAIRELREEAALTLAHPGTLVAFSRWITPVEVKIRFDTLFFLTELPAGQEPRVDGEECVDLGWFTPRAALEAHRAGEIALVFPTIKHLEQLDPFSSARALLEHARGLTVEPVLPRVVVEGDGVRVLLPGEPGY